MNRNDARALAQATLEATGSYVAVYNHEPGSFGGQSPVATVHSKSLGLQDFSHGEVQFTGEVAVSIYVVRGTEQDDTDGEAVEDQLDELVRAAMLELRTAFLNAGVLGEFTITPSGSGYPPKPLDGKIYRMERFAVPFDSQEDDPRW